MLKSDVFKFGKYAAMLGALLSSGTGMTFGHAGQNQCLAARRPTGAALRNPADPFQAERIELARAKRTRKAAALVRNFSECYARNRTLNLDKMGGSYPFYVNR